MPAEMEMTTDAPGIELVSRPEWKLVCRIAASGGFTKSERLPRFLIYICEQFLTGNAHQINEQRIGAQIFNRGRDYNPGEDNIVRSYARLLRKRLDLYFAGEGRDEPMRIVIPRGGYVPVFESLIDVVKISASSTQTVHNEDARVELIATENESDAKETMDWERKPAAPFCPWLFASSRRASLIGLIVGLILASIVWWGVGAVQAQRAISPAHVLWAQLFQQNRDTLIVPSDSGLDLLQSLTSRSINLEQYANGSYLSEVPPQAGMDERALRVLGRGRYTSVASLNIVSRLVQLPEFVANRAQIRVARSVTAEDFKNSNVVLLGSVHSDPWVSLFESRLSFRLQYAPQEDASYVLNEHPIGTERKIYRETPESTSNATYGTIAFLPNLDGTGHVLILQGLNMAGTQATAGTLFTARAIQAVLKQASMPDGTLHPFELLVETTSIGASAPEFQVIATRIHS